MITKSSGSITTKDVFRLFGLFEGEDGNEGEEGGGDQGENDSEGSSGTKQEVNDPDKQRLSAEAAKYRVQARDEKAAREAAEARVKEFEDKDKTETEKLRSDSETLAESNATLKANNVSLMVQNAALKSASKFDFRDINDAMKFAVDGSGIKGDEENLEELITEQLTKLAKDKPYLLKEGKEDESDDGKKEPSGRMTNGKKTSKEGLDEATLIGKFPALQR